MQSQSEIQTDRQIKQKDNQIYSITGRQTETERQIQSKRQTDRQTKTIRKTDKISQTHRQIVRQID